MKCRYWRQFIASLILGLAAVCVQADIDVAEYATSQSVRTEHERQALQSAFTEERRREALQTAEKAALTGRRLAEEQERLAARPYPVRLTEARCSKCHTGLNYRLNAHALPGWVFVVLRMRYLNQAELTWQEIWIISRHLSVENSTGFAVAMYEWLALPLTGLLLWAAVQRWRKLRKLTLTKENES